MQFVHYDLGQLGGGETANVTVRERVFVRLMDSHNFSLYQRGQRCRFHGGQVLRSPIQLQVPAAGHWYVVLDYNGGSGSIHSSVTVSS